MNPIHIYRTIQSAAVLWLLALTALLILSSIFRWRAQDYDYHGNCARAGDTMRRHLGEHLRRIPLQILYRQRSGELNALLAGTIDETYNHTLIVSNMLIAAVFTPLATALITLIWDWRLGLILLISFPLIVPIQHGTQPLMARAKARLARANASLNAELLEYSQGLPVLKAANSAGTRLPRLQQAIGAVETIQRDAQILVFDHGQLVEQGDHASLIAQNGRYARLWQAGEAARHWRIGSAEQ